MADFKLVRTLTWCAILGTILIFVGWVWTLVDIFADLGPYLLGLLMMGFGLILLAPLFVYFALNRE
jgi:hypothetical protein